MGSGNFPGLVPRVSAFFDRFPSAQQVYSSTRLYHSTHSMYVPGILSEGLRSNPDLFPRNHGQFLLDIYNRYGPGEPSDVEYIQDRILNDRLVYVSTERPGTGFASYGIPERLMFLARGLYSLSRKESLTVAECDFAAEALQGHVRGLTENDPAIVDLEIDPLAPSLANNRLGAFALERIDDAEAAEFLAERVDGNYSKNIPIKATIEPAFISIHRTTPITPERATAGIYSNAGWADLIR